MKSYLTKKLAINLLIFNFSIFAADAIGFTAPLISSYGTYIDYFNILKDATVDAPGEVSIYKIRKSSFDNVNSSIEIPDTVENDMLKYVVRRIIADDERGGTFCEEYISNLKIPNSVKEIGERAFTNSIIGGIELPDTVTLGRESFF